MCVIFAKPPGRKIPYTWLFNAHVKNPHGIGLMYKTPESIQIAKYLDFKEGLEHLNTLEHAEVFVHVRKITVGYFSIEQTHPFELPKLGAALMHNGTLLPLSDDNSTSDTVRFSELLNSVLTLDNESSLIALMRPFIENNRVVILRANGEPLYMGHWLDVDGIKVSNLYAWTAWAAAGSKPAPCLY